MEARSERIVPNPKALSTVERRATTTSPRGSGAECQTLPDIKQTAHIGRGDPAGKQSSWTTEKEARITRSKRRPLVEEYEEVPTAEESAQAWNSTDHLPIDAQLAQLMANEWVAETRFDTNGDEGFFYVPTVKGEREDGRRPPVVCVFKPDVRRWADRTKADILGDYERKFDESPAASAASEPAASSSCALKDHGRAHL